MFRSKVMAKNYFFAALALSALRRLRVQSDLLDGTAFEALPLVVCTKVPMYKKSIHLASSFYFLGIADPTSTCCRLAHTLDHTHPLDLHSACLHLHRGLCTLVFSLKYLVVKSHQLRIWFIHWGFDAIS